MRNTIEQGKVTFLIYGIDGAYTGICREFGFVEQGKTFREVRDKLDRGAELLLETVKKHPHLEPSLNTSPPFKYLVTFYVIGLFSFFASMYYDCVSLSRNSRMTYA